MSEKVGDCGCKLERGPTGLRMVDCPLHAAAQELLDALRGLREELNRAIRMDVKKHYSLMVADAAAGKAIYKAEGERTLLQQAGIDADGRKLPPDAREVLREVWDYWAGGDVPEDLGARIRAAIGLE